jgi:hypothetical protein
VQGKRTPEEIREGVREALLAALRRDFELAGGRTARRLAAAGAAGVAGALGATALLAGHPFGHHPPWHVAFFSATWAGLLVVALSLVFLGIRTPTYSVAKAVTVGVLGLGVAGVCGLLCPDRHFLVWWMSTVPGAFAASVSGALGSALCFGLLATAFVAGAAALPVLRASQESQKLSTLSAAALFVLLLPGVALQSVGTSLGVFAAWTAGTALGAYIGVRAAGPALLGARRLTRAALVRAGWRRPEGGSGR